MKLPSVEEAVCSPPELNVGQVSLGILQGTHALALDARMCQFRYAVGGWILPQTRVVFQVFTSSLTDCRKALCPILVLYMGAWQSIIKWRAISD